MPKISVLVSEHKKTKWKTLSSKMIKCYIYFNGKIHFNIDKMYLKKIIIELNWYYCGLVYIIGIIVVKKRTNLK